MDDVKSQTSVCPDVETLSAWFDGETSLSPEQREHVKTCPLCGQRLADYRNIGNLMHTDVHSGRSDMEISEQILSSTRRMVKHNMDFALAARQKKRRAALAWGIRIAALFVMAALFFWLFFSSRTEEKKTKTDIPYSPVIAGSSFAEFHAPGKIYAYLTKAAASASTSPVELSLGGKYFCVFDGKDTVYPGIPGYIRSQLNQTWFCNSFNMAELKKHLNVLLDELSILRYESKKLGPGVFRLDMTLNARQLAVMVKQLADWGLYCAGDVSPNPHQNFFIGSGAREISCSLIMCVSRDAGLLSLPVQ